MTRLTFLTSLLVAWAHIIPVLSFHAGQRPPKIPLADKSGARRVQTSQTPGFRDTRAIHPPFARLHAETIRQAQDTFLPVSEATKILQTFDAAQSQFAKEENIGMGGGVSASMYVTTLSEEEVMEIRTAVLVTVARANQEREEDCTVGRVMLGICAEDCLEGLGTLKSWVSALKLPRGLLHGMDQDGIPIDPSTLGSVYIKYNTGGALTFSEMRKSRLGFDAIWKPGDALLETYDGDFRGVYLNVELRDGVFRQFGVLPLTLFDDV